MRGQIREIRIFDIFLYFFLPLVGYTALGVGYFFFIRYLPEVHFTIPLAVLILAVLFITRYFAIGLVLLYKALAPKSTRDRCRFEPTCSTYMIMAIQKYGLFRGVYRGIRRIMRCKPPNGGTDLP